MPDLRPVLRKIPVVGNYFRDPDSKQVFASLKVGDPVLLTPEPDNPHDRYAVKVEVFANDQRVHVGYLPATVSAAIHLLREHYDVDLGAAVTEVNKNQVLLGVVADVEE